MVKGKYELVVDWHNPKDKEPICIYEAEGNNPCMMELVWDSLKVSIFDKLWEGDCVRLIHNFILDNIYNKDMKRIYDYWEIEVPTPNFAEGLTDSEVLAWYGEVLKLIVRTLTKLHISFHIDDPKQHEEITKAITDILKGHGEKK